MNEEILKFYTKETEFLWKNSVIGLAFLSADGTWLKVNPMLCSITEYSENELLHKTFQQITHPDDTDDDVEMTKKIVVGEMDWYPMTKRYITKSGAVIWVKLTVNAVRDDEGNFICFFSQIFPIDPKLIGPQPPIAKGSEKVRSKGFSLDGVGVYLTKNWVWISPIGAGIMFGLWKFLNFLYEIISLYISTNPGGPTPPGT